MDNFTGKRAFVTGAASGIGLGMVRAFLAEGMEVAMADIEPDALNEAAANLETNAVLPLVCDVSDRQSVVETAQRAMEELGNIHVVCNNAGVSSGGLIEDLDEGDWLWTIGVNYMGVVHGCEVFARHFKAHGEGGHMVNTASMAGVIARSAGWGPYNSTKYAVVGLTEVLREEGKLGDFSASVLCPGPVDTNIMGADRNRPGRFGPQQSKVAFTDISDALKEGLHPDVVGRLVVEAIKADRLHIFTDPRMEKFVEQRFQGMAEDFEWARHSDALVSAGAPGAIGD